MLDVTIANWIIAITCPLCGVFLFRILNRIEKKQDIHDQRINGMETRVSVIESTKDNSKETLDKILIKLDIIKSMQ